MSRRSLVVAWAFPWVISAACGGRTGEDLPSYTDGGAGASLGSGGQASQGGALVGRGGSAPPKPSAGGQVVRPPIPGGGGVSVGGGFPVGAFGNVGGFGTGGAPIGCGPPMCACGDCYNQCVCRLNALGSAGICKDMCFGAGGVPVGAGGLVGAGGVQCAAADSGVSTVCAFTPAPLPSCCPASGGCGILLDLTGSPSIPVEGGCQPYGQPGFIDGRCPDLGELLNAPSTGGPFGCCRPDGTCGVSVDTLGLGCLPTLRNGARFSCQGIVDAGHD